MTPSSPNIPGKRPLRILSIGHSYAVTMNRNLPEAIQRAAGAQCEVTVAAPTCFRGSRDLRSITLQESSTDTCPVIPISTRLTRFVHLFYYGRELRALAEQPWDLVHCWEEPYIVSGYQIAQTLARRAPLVFRTAQSLNKQYPPPFGFMERRVLQNASGWICSGNTVAETLKQRPLYGELPMAQIPLGVDTRRFHPNADQAASVYRHLGWTESGPPVVGYLGRFTPEKGLRILMQALERCGTPWRALFVGAGSLHGELGKWARRFPDRVRICTDVVHDDVPRFLNAMHVLCTPSQTTPKWREQFGRMLIEAFACGVPVIGSESGEIPHVLGRTGRLVAEQDVNAWAAAIAEILNQPNERRRMAEEGRDRALNEFDWSIIGRSHLDFFKRIIDHKKF